MKSTGLRGKERGSYATACQDSELVVGGDLLHTPALDSYGDLFGKRGRKIMAGHPVRVGASGSRRCFSSDERDPGEPIQVLTR